MALSAWEQQRLAAIERVLIAEEPGLVALAARFGTRPRQRRLTDRLQIPQINRIRLGLAYFVAVAMSALLAAALVTGVPGLALAALIATPPAILGVWLGLRPWSSVRRPRLEGSPRSAADPRTRGT